MCALGAPGFASSQLCVVLPCRRTCAPTSAPPVMRRQVARCMTGGSDRTRWDALGRVLRCSGSSRRPTTAHSRPRRATRRSSSPSVYSLGRSAVAVCRCMMFRRVAACHHQSGRAARRRCMLRSALVTLWCASCIGLCGACTAVPAAPNEPAVTAATSPTGLGLTPATSACTATSSAPGMGSPPPTSAPGLA